MPVEARCPTCGSIWPGLRYRVGSIGPANKKKRKWCEDSFHSPVVPESAPPDRLKLAESLEFAARCFYGEQYGDTPLEPEMVTFATRFAACQLTGYKTEEEVSGAEPSRREKV